MEDTDTTLKSDHQPLHTFLEKNIFKSKVNNWAMEIELLTFSECTQTMDMLNLVVP